MKNCLKTRFPPPLSQGKGRWAEFFQEGLALCPLGTERNQPPLYPHPLFSESAWFQVPAGGCGLAQSGWGALALSGVFGSGRCNSGVHATEWPKQDTLRLLSSWPRSYCPLKWHGGAKTQWVGQSIAWEQRRELYNIPLWDQPALNLSPAIFFF